MMFDCVLMATLLTFIGFYAGKLADELEQTDPHDQP